MFLWERMSNYTDILPQDKKVLVKVSLPEGLKLSKHVAECHSHALASAVGFCRVYWQWFTFLPNEMEGKVEACKYCRFLFLH